MILSNIVQNRGDNVLQNIISSQASDYDYITWNNSCPNEYSKQFVKSKSNIYSFTITDEDFNPIHLNGLNCVFTLMLYKSNDLGSLLKGFIKLQVARSLTNDAEDHKK
jgi:hypothetical protein